MLLVGKFAIEYGIISERKFSVLLTKGVGVFGSLGQSEDLLDSKNFKTVTTGIDIRIFSIYALNMDTSIYPFFYSIDNKFDNDGGSSSYCCFKTQI